MIISAGVVPWFAFGVVLSIVHGFRIARAVGRISPDRLSGVRKGIFAGYLVRYLTVVVAMTLAVQQSAAACVSISLGMVMGRWITVYRRVSGTVG